MKNSTKLFSLGNFSVVVFVLFAVLTNITLAGGGGNPAPEGLSTAIVTGLHKYTDITFENPYNPPNTMSVSAGTFQGTIDGNPAKFYCVDISNYIAYNQGYTDSLTTPSQITYILNNYFPFKPYPYTGSASTVEKEAASIQAAIWHFSDGMNANTITNSDVKNRALAIIADANANHANVVPVPTLLIQPYSQALPNGTPASFQVKAVDQYGQPLNGITVNVSASTGSLSGTSAVTGLSGLTPPFTLNQASADTSLLTATATAVIPQGTKYFHKTNPGGKQKLVLATPTYAPVQTNGIVTWSASADLSIAKTVDDANPSNGDNITFSIVVTNNGPNAASNITVSEVLSPAFVFVSSNASQGTYNVNSGIWNVGSLANGATATLTITVNVSVQALNQASLSLGAATGFNVFVLEDLFQPSADTEGKMAIGRDAYLANYSVGDLLPNSNGTVDVLVVGRNLTYISGAVTGGNVVYGNSTNLPISAVTIHHGTLIQGSPIDFNAAGIYLNTLSVNLSNYTVNGTTTFQWGGLSLVGTNPLMNVFFVSGAQLSSANNFDLNVPAGSVALINIDGQNVSWGGGLNVNGTTISNVLYNFYQADTLTIQGIDVRGSILAPKTHVNFVSGVQNGQMMCKSLKGPGQFNHTLFTGVLPLDTTITNCVSVSFFMQGNCNLTGYTTYTQGGWGSPSNSQPGQVRDTYFATVFPAGLVVGGPNTITLTSAAAVKNFLPQGSTPQALTQNYVDPSGSNISVLAGQVVAATLNVQFSQAGFLGTNATPLGQLLFSSGTFSGMTINDFLVIANAALGGQSVAYSLSDINAAATAINENFDNGNSNLGYFTCSSTPAPIVDPNSNNNNSCVSVTVSANNGGGNGGGGNGGGGNGNWQLLGSLPGGDIVWSIAGGPNGKLYVGSICGYVYCSSDNGATWTRINNQWNAGTPWTIRVDANSGAIYVGTSMGVYKTTDGGANWTLTLSGKDVRALELDSFGNIYAGTGGAGVFKSVDGGANWTENSNGLSFYKVIQAMTKNSSDEIFAGTIGNGVAKTVDFAANWNFVNMPYPHIWAMASTSTGTIFAGTYGDGLYRSTDGGANFHKVTLSVPHVYSLVVDASDNIYASSYVGGVYASSDNGNTWTNVGMNGFGVSTMIVNPNASTIYAGTKNGEIYMMVSNTTSADKNIVPFEFDMKQNYPNPFNPSTVIEFSLPETQKVTMGVYNILGELVRVLVDEQLSAGQHTITFDAGGLSSGIYIYRLNAGSQTITKKMILQK